MDSGKKKFLAVCLPVALVAILTVAVCSATAATSGSASASGSAPAASGSAAASAASAASASTSTSTEAATPANGVYFTAEEWMGTYPDEYATYMENAVNYESSSYLDMYPWLSTVYTGTPFAKDYNEPRGHWYTLYDVSHIGRKHPTANCLACKGPQYVLGMAEDPEYYKTDFDTAFADFEEGITCYDCHQNDPSAYVGATRQFWLTATDGMDIDPSIAACAQCHNEYYFTADTGTIANPYDNGIEPDSILAYYNSIGFSDYTNDATGVQQIKVQHPDSETYMTSKMAAAGVTCVDCHMETTTNADGETFTSHYITTPLKSPSIIENVCLKCHTDQTVDSMTETITSLQSYEETTLNEVGQQMADADAALADAVSANSLDADALAQVQSDMRDAQFYMDYVLVENSEGFHNPELTTDCLTKAASLLDGVEAALA